MPHGRAFRRVRKKTRKRRNNKEVSKIEFILLKIISVFGFFLAFYGAIVDYNGIFGIGVTLFGILICLVSLGTIEERKKKGLGSLARVKERVIP